MAELYNAAFSWVNLPYTVLLIVIVTYWLVVIVGLIDLDIPDVDLDTDIDPGTFGHSILGFLNIGEVPVILYATIVTVSMWIVSIQFHHYLDGYLGAHQGVAAGALAIPNLIFALLVAKLLTAPFKRLNRRHEPETPLVGQVCVVRTAEANEKSGECALTYDNVPVSIQARTRDGEVLHKGDSAMIQARLQESNTYIITKYVPAKP